MLSPATIRPNDLKCSGCTVSGERNGCISSRQRCFGIGSIRERMAMPEGAGDRAGPNLARRMCSRLSHARFIPDFWPRRMSCFTSAPFSPYWPTPCQSEFMPSHCRRPRIREPAIAPRALQFAADGWSVLQLVEWRNGWRRKLRSTTEEMYRVGAVMPPLLAIGTITAGRYRPLHKIPADLADCCRRTRPRPPALPDLYAAPARHWRSVIRLPASGQAFTANGLAG